MICLIIPPSPFLLDERVFMSLGVLKVAASLESAGFPVQVLDLSGVANYEDAVRAHLFATPALTYGLTATSPQFPAAVKIAKIIRDFGKRIIIGGPHATLVNAARKRGSERAVRAYEHIRAMADVIVAGDGELAIFPALTADRGTLIDADDRHSPYWLNDTMLNDSPWPARHLLDVPSYRYQIDGVPALSLIAQLGCPFGCGFCAGRHSPMLRHIRTRSAQSIVNEMLMMQGRYGCRGFMFYDDELNVSPGMTELMDLMAQIQETTGLEWRLRGFIKAELFTDAQAAAMYRAGFRWILVGFESGADRILDNINKKASKDDNTRCIAIAHAHGLKVKALMSLGHPGESGETIDETEQWLLDTKPDDFDATVITPYPGSPYYDEARQIADEWVYACRNGDRLYQSEVDYSREADYYKGVPGAYVSHVWTDELSREDLVRRRDQLESRVRERLGIPYNSAAPAKLYEHSMGQSPIALN
jgi:radical SAM superfamily enzyme YgiQ (UPF0313 family)